MKQAHENIDQMLPYGELLRGFVTQPSVSKGELKKVLRSRGIFFNSNEKDTMIPSVSTMLLSPSEFEILKECQNTREDNLKKSSSRIDLSTDIPLIDCLPNLTELQESISPDYINYELTSPPRILISKEQPNRVEIHFELERHDLDKSWYESKNTFVGNIILEKLSSDEISITKSYTSIESEEVANKFQSFYVNHLKKSGVVAEKSELRKILFKDFSNKERIHFFWRLTSKMDGVYFKFIDIEDMEFRPDESQPLPEKIDWMAKKRELILKGTDIHNTFFIKEEIYYPHLQFWGLIAKFKFQLSGVNGNCSVNFVFRDFISKQEDAEFEINISSLSHEQTLIGSREKNELKQELLNLLETKKNEIYHSFIKQLREEEEKIIKSDKLVEQGLAVNQD